MSKPYLAVADIHANAWSQFSTIGEDGVNSRLKIQLNELERAADGLISRGGEWMFIAGDLFHVRGSIKPEVFNPTHDCFKRILQKGVRIIAIPGNHDLAGKDTTALGNSFQTLGSLDGFSVYTKMDIPFGGHEPKVMVLPWCATKDELREKIAAFDGHWSCKSTPRSKIDLIIHVGIDGVLQGVPEHGLGAAEVASWGFKRVFAGDYHNHKVMEDGKVVSIGAMAHQTWSDIGSKAGFVFVYPDRIEWQATHAPEFVEITGETPPEEIPLLVDGNYVRVRAMKLTDTEVAAFRTELTKMGALGVTFMITRETVSARSTGSGTKSATLDESVAQFIDKMEDIDVAAVKAEAADVLTTIRSVEA